MLERTNTSMKRETCRQTSLIHQINILALNRLEKTPKDNIIVLMVICKFSYPTTMPNWAKYAVALKLSPFSSSNHSISISSSSMVVLSAFLSMSSFSSNYREITSCRFDFQNGAVTSYFFRSDSYRNSALPLSFLIFLL